MTRQDIRNTVGNYSCCLSQKGYPLLLNARGGTLDPCCTARHNFAHAAADLLHCARYDDLWYKITLTFTVELDGVDPIFSYVEFVGTEGDIGNIGPAEPRTLTATTDAEAAQEIVELYNSGFHPYGFYVYTTATYLQDNVFTIDIYGGSVATDGLTFWPAGWKYARLIFTELDETIVETTDHKYNCLTGAEICEVIERGLKDYCGDNCSGNKYAPKPIA